MGALYEEERQNHYHILDPKILLSSFWGLSYFDTMSLCGKSTHISTNNRCPMHAISFMSWCHAIYKYHLTCWLFFWVALFLFTGSVSFAECLASDHTNVYNLSVISNSSKHFLFNHIIKQVWISYLFLTNLTIVRVMLNVFLHSDQSDAIQQSMTSFKPRGKTASHKFNFKLFNETWVFNEWIAWKTYEAKDTKQLTFVIYGELDQRVTLIPLFWILIPSKSNKTI